MEGLFMTQVINTCVSIQAYYFAGERMRSFPKAIEYNGRAVTFMSGLRYDIRRGKSRIHLYDMEAEEGRATYRLERNGNQWTLLSRKGDL